VPTKVRLASGRAPSLQLVLLQKEYSTVSFDASHGGFPPPFENFYGLQFRKNLRFKRISCVSRD
jgi:hypothetical protein